MQVNQLRVVIESSIGSVLGAVGRQNLVKSILFGGVRELRKDRNHELVKDLMTEEIEARGRKRRRKK